MSMAIPDDVYSEDDREDRVLVAVLTKAAPSSDDAMLACELSEWTGNPALCRWCNEPNPSTSHRWCGEGCLVEYRQNHWWKEARERAKRRDRRCVDCRTDPVEHGGLLEVHHKVPCAGTRTAGCLHHLDGLVTLCQHHHDVRHRPGPPAVSPRTDGQQK